MARTHPRARWPFRLTFQGVVFLLLTLFIGGKAVSAGNNTQFLIFVTFAGLFLLAAGLAVSTPRRLDLRRRLPAVGRAGEPLEYELEVRHRRRFRFAYWLAFRDESGAEGKEPVEAFLPMVGPGRSAVLKLVVASPRRGWRRFTEVRIQCRPPVDLLRWTRRVPLEDRVLVYPRRWHWRKGRRFEALGAADQVTRPQGERWPELDEFAGLRDFRPGDNPRHIQWKVSARLPGQVFVRQFDHPHDRECVVWLDNFFTAAEESRYRDAFEDNLGCVSALMDKALEEGCRVTLVCCAPQLRIVRVGLRSRDRAELNELLATLEPCRQTAPPLLGAVSFSVEAMKLAVLLDRERIPLFRGSGSWIFLTPDRLRTFLSPASDPLPAEPEAAAPPGRRSTPAATAALVTTAPLAGTGGR